MEKVIKGIVSAIDKNLSLTQDQREVAEYALYNVIITSGTVLGALITGIVTKSLPEVAIALITGSVFRWTTGGAHFSTPYRCMAVSIFVPALVALVSKKIGQIHGSGLAQLFLGLAFALFIISAIMFYLYAPAETENKPIPQSQRKKLRVWAFIILTVWAFVMFFFYEGNKLSLLAASICGLTWQVISVTPAGYRLFQKIDNRLTFLK